VEVGCGAPIHITHRATAPAARLRPLAMLAAAAAAARRGVGVALGGARRAASGDASDGLRLPGRPTLPFASSLTFVGGRGNTTPVPVPIPVFRTLTEAGAEVDGVTLNDDLDQASALAVHASLARLQTMDALFHECQRQGRFSFYMTSAGGWGERGERARARARHTRPPTPPSLPSPGEEATSVASAAALDPGDAIFAQYREAGALLHRGFPVAAFAHNCYGTALDPGLGRQMPIHYGSKALHYHTVSSPLATQLPHAVGHAYATAAAAARTGAPPTISVAYFGDGAASEGDAHAAFNFAAVLRSPVIFLCRDNGWAISTPSSQQYAGDGVAGRGPAYGMPSARVDGGDARAVFAATAAARRLALETRGPVLLEAVSHRAGHHSTSDDASRYRGPSLGGPADPATRFGAWLTAKGWWCADREAALRRAAREETLAALAEAEAAPRASVASMFDDVYDSLPPSLIAQRAVAVAAARARPDRLPPGVAPE